MRGSARLGWLLILFTIGVSSPIRVLAQPNVTGGIYVVQRGDYLGRIAQQFGVTVSCLANANHIADPNRIYVGQTLDIATCQQQGGGAVVPAAQAVQPALTTQTTVIPVPTTYTIQAGDQFFDITRRYNLDANCVAQANHILDARAIQPGQVLNIAACRTVSSITLTASVYTIQAGDQLFTVAQRLGVDRSCLARVNGLTDPARIAVGQVLQVEPCIAQGGAIAPLPTSQTYVVQQGDKMVYLAASFGVDLLCLARTNAIGNPDYLRVGETLRINYAECRTSSEVAGAFH